MKKIIEILIIAVSMIVLCSMLVIWPIGTVITIFYVLICIFSGFIL